MFVDSKQLPFNVTIFAREILDGYVLELKNVLKQKKANEIKSAKKQLNLLIQKCQVVELVTRYVCQRNSL